MHLFGHTLDHDYYFELPLKGSGIPNQFLVFSTIGLISIKHQAILVRITGSERALDQDCGEIVLLWSPLGKIQH